MFSVTLDMWQQNKVGVSDVYYHSRDVRQQNKKDECDTRSVGCLVSNERCERTKQDEYCVNVQRSELRLLSFRSDGQRNKLVISELDK